MSVRIESLDQEARGIARAEGKAVFIDGALPGELVEYSPYRKKPNYDLAQLSAVIHPSAMRVEPRCIYFAKCGGCNMQHLDERAQVAIKQRILEDNLARIGKVRPDSMLPPIYGMAWRYRHRARLAVRHVEKKGGVLVGFHEKKSSFVVEMESCEVLPEHVAALLRPLRDLIGELTVRNRIPQIDVAVGEAVTVLVLRILDALSEGDESLLKEFAERQRIQFWLQPKGPESAYPFHPLNAPDLYYRLPEFALTIAYRPSEFTQINPSMNHALVSRAVNLLDPRPEDRIGDLFCGLGNFSLALARRGARVVGVEGNGSLVQRAMANAAANGLTALTRFVAADLFEDAGATLENLGRFDKMLIDPPRDGAVEVVKALAEEAPRCIAYVSCNPATLARDAALLVHTKGYTLRAAGIINMFPHTAHVESIALFER